MIMMMIDDDGLMIINKSGVAIRIDVKDLRVMGRATQGVRLINLKGNDSIAAVAKVAQEDDADVRSADGNEPLTYDGGLKHDIADLEEDAVIKVADGPSIIVV